MKNITLLKTHVLANNLSAYKQKGIIDGLTIFTV